MLLYSISDVILWLCLCDAHTQRSKIDHAHGVQILQGGSKYFHSIRTGGQNTAGVQVLRDIPTAVATVQWIELRRAEDLRGSSNEVVHGKRRWTSACLVRLGRRGQRSTVDFRERERERERERREEERERKQREKEKKDKQKEREQGNRDKNNENMKRNCHCIVITM